LATTVGELVEKDKAVLSLTLFCVHRFAVFAAIARVQQLSNSIFNLKLYLSRALTVLCVYL